MNDSSVVAESECAKLLLPVFLNVRPDLHHLLDVSVVYAVGAHGLGRTWNCRITLMKSDVSDQYRAQCQRTGHTIEQAVSRTVEGFCLTLLGQATPA